MLDQLGRGTRGDRPARRRAWSATAALVAAATLGAACGDDAADTAGGDGAGDGDSADVRVMGFEATGAFLASASERSASEPYRFEMSLAMSMAGGGESFDVEAPLSTGVVDGDSFSQRIDMNEYMSQMASSMGAAAGAMPDLDLSIDTVVDGGTMWLRAPMFAQFSDLGLDGGVPEPFAELGDGWGRVDIAALGPEAVGEAARMGGSPTGGDPRQVLEMLETAENTTELGEDTVDGDRVEGIGATMTMSELIEAGGTDLDTVREQAAAEAGTLGPEEAEAAVEGMLDADMPIEAWVDGEGYVRRIVMTMDMGAMVGAMSDETGGLEEFVIGTTVEFTDYGADVDVAPPPDAADAVDLTDAFAELTAGG